MTHADGRPKKAPRTAMRPDQDFETDWVSKAACAGVPTEVFFPGYNARENTSEARNICKKCPVVKECLDYALEVPIDFGIWGGLTPHERHRYNWKKSYPRHKSRG
tara:strand:- start:187 stop:501 length:315 start_codon:yes stop_codon:yes gene_type:complete